MQQMLEKIIIIFVESFLTKHICIVEMTLISWLLLHFEYIDYITSLYLVHKPGPNFLRKSASSTVLPPMPG